jgi:regulator of protease activity HflC (stomatin/prohibitin superfamily)
MGIFRVRLIVKEYERALIYQDGRFVRTVGAGRYGLWKFVHKQSAVVFDMRQRPLSLAGQEILTKDHVPLRVTLAAAFQVVDPVAAEHKVEAWQQQVYVDVQLALRQVVAGFSFDEVLDQKTGLGERVLALASPGMAAYGVSLIAAAVKDVTMPGSIRDMMLKTVEAEKSAQASLIKAREEVAAARARANAARLIADNPAVLRLKELETLTEMAKSPGSTVVFTGGLSVADLGRTAARGLAGDPPRSD